MSIQGGDGRYLRGEIRRTDDNPAAYRLDRILGSFQCYRRVYRAIGNVVVPSGIVEKTDEPGGW